MKYFISLIIFLFLFLKGCIKSAKQQEKVNYAKRIDVEWSDENGSLYGESFTVVAIDSCEYLFSIRSSRFAHKGNCKYCIERNKNNFK